jgi:hypothetical protein
MAVAPAVAAPITNTPQHAPDLLDFGTVAEGSSAKRTFSLITNAPGYVTVNIPPGPFHVAEFREMGPAPVNKGLGALPPMPAVGGARSRIKYQESQNGPYQWSMAPNTEMQIDIVFAPKAANGPQSATLNATGPGPHGNWALVIPLRGTLSPVKLTPEGPQPKAGKDNLSSVPLSGKAGSSPGAAAPPTARKLSPGEALQHMRSAGKLVLVATVRNSKLSPSGVDTKTLALLRQQKQGADSARARFITANPRPSGRQTTKSIGSAGGQNPGAASTEVANRPAGNNMSQASLPVGNTLACTKAAPDALIFSINDQKKATSAVFTTDPDNNRFTLEGCNFGDAQGSLHLYGGFAHGNIPFDISLWTDKRIDARVQPDLAGELDRDNITLVIVSGNGHQTAFQGYKFYAARQTYMLPGIPNIEAKSIFGPPDPDHCEHADGWTFMSCGVGFDPDNGILYVTRWGVKGDKGTDQFSISGLKPGFEISDVSLWITPEISNKQGWSVYSFAENISVNYVFDWKKPIADYGLRISVAGPRGIDSVWK